MPKRRVSSRTFSSSSRSRNPWAVTASPEVGSVSRYFALAYLAVLRANSALVPPMTTARWYGGQAAVPRVRSFSSRNAIMASSLRIAFVSWYR